MIARRRRERVRDRLSRRVVSIAVSAVLVIGAGIVAIRTLDPDVVVSTISEADPWLLSGAVLVSAISWPIRGRRYGDILGAMDRRAGIAFLTATILISQTANLAVPARAGDGVRAYLVRTRRGVPYPTGVASLAVERAFDLVAIAILGIIAFVGLSLAGWSQLTAGPPTVRPRHIHVIAVVAIGLAVAMLGLARIGPRIEPRVRSRLTGTKWSAILDATARCGRSVQAVAQDPRAIATVGLLSLAAWCMDVLTAVLVLGAVRGGLGASTFELAFVLAGTLAVSVGNLAKALPLTHGGIGVYEAAFTGVLVSVVPIGVGTALLAAIIDHAIKNVVTIVGGLLAAVSLDISPGAIRVDPEERTVRSSNF